MRRSVQADVTGLQTSPDWPGLDWHFASLDHRIGFDIGDIQAGQPCKDILLKPSGMTRFAYDIHIHKFTQQSKKLPRMRINVRQAGWKLHQQASPFGMQRSDGFEKLLQVCFTSLQTLVMRNRTQ